MIVKRNKSKFGLQQPARKHLKGGYWVFFFLWWPEFEPKTLHILCIDLINWAKVTETVIEFTYSKSMLSNIKFDIW